MSTTDDKNGGGLRATRPGSGGGTPLRATVGDTARPGVALRADLGAGGRGSIAAPLRPPGPRPAPPKSKLPLIILLLLPAVAGGLWYFTREDTRLSSLPLPSPPQTATPMPAAPAAPAPSTAVAPSGTAPAVPAPPVPAPPVPATGTASRPGLPIVAGNAEPYKEAPQDPGGLEVPFKESLVYNELKPAPGQTPAPRVERLLPPPEEPLPKPAAPEPPAAAAAAPASGAAPVEPTPVANETPAIVRDAPVSTVAANPDESGAIAVGEAAVPASVPQAPEPAQAPAPASASGVLGQLPVAPGSAEAEALKAAEAAPDEEKPEPARAAAPPAAAQPGSREDVFQRLGTPGAPPPAADTQTAAAAAPAAASATAGEVFRIQLASVRSEAEAQAEWRRLQGRFPNELGRLTPVFTAVTLPQGTFVRVQAGPLSEAEARARCAALTGQPGVSGCRAVRVAGTP